MDADTCNSLVYSYHPQRICWQKKVALGVGALDNTEPLLSPEAALTKRRNLLFSDM